MNNDVRIKQIKSYLETIYNGEDFILEAIKGDASFRRYFRLNLNNRSYIVMDSPPLTEPVLPFIKSTNLLFQKHLL